MGLGVDPAPPPPVGASLLAMVVNDNVGGLTPRGVLGFIASRLAPTGGAVLIIVAHWNPPASSAPAHIAGTDD
ncbi:hypothetical protein DKY63_01740 [Pseudomonas putida]|uniref:Uncharacterized protein n=1 Tax=Pseudomonas putida TaxID=303 RepID=A0A2Z4RFH1_PSEPU|nr:hypothetical protein DKY63_01740 [Pseudomonas putida]